MTDTSREAAIRAEARAEALREAAESLGALLPENGAAEPQDKADKLIDSVRRDDIRAILALIDKPEETPDA
jgi:hypothetical protein